MLDQKHTINVGPEDQLLSLKPSVSGFEQEAIYYCFVGQLTTDIDYANKLFKPASVCI